MVKKIISSRFSGNSEAFASEFLENLEEMIPCYDDRLFNLKG